MLVRAARGVKVWEDGRDYKLFDNEEVDFKSNLFLEATGGTLKKNIILKAYGRNPDIILISRSVGDGERMEKGFYYGRSIGFKIKPDAVVSSFNRLNSSLTMDSLFIEKVLLYEHFGIMLFIEYFYRGKRFVMLRSMSETLTDETVESIVFSGVKSFANDLLTYLSRLNLPVSSIECSAIKSLMGGSSYRGYALSNKNNFWDVPIDLYEEYRIVYFVESDEVSKLPDSI